MGGVGRVLVCDEGGDGGFDAAVAEGEEGEREGRPASWVVCEVMGREVVKRTRQPRRFRLVGLGLLVMGGGEYAAAFAFGLCAIHAFLVDGERGDDRRMVEGEHHYRDGQP